MKFLIGTAAAAAFALMVSPAFAQATVSANCSGFDAAPTIPDGATATRAELEAANAVVQAWVEARTAKLVICQDEVNAMSQAFNTAEQERRTFIANWTAEVNEFNARESAAPNRSERNR